MQKYNVFAVIVLFSIITSIQARTIGFPTVEREILCRCVGTYARFQYEILQGSFINIKVIDSSSDEVCDEYHSKELKYWQRGVNYPDGVVGIGVWGSSAADKNVSLEECLSGKEFEIKVFFYPEETIIDLEKINRPLE